MSLNLPLTTPAERRAALAALATYTDLLDGHVAVIAPEDNPEVGTVPIPAPVVAEVIPTATAVFHSGGVPSPVSGVVGEPPQFLTAPPAPAPSMTPLPNTPLPAVEVDSKGVAWNAELHAGNKSKNKDGTWRARRNSGGATDDAPEAPPAPPAPAAPVAAPTDTPADFQALMARVMPAITGGKVQVAKVNEVLGMCGVPNLPALATMPAAVPVVWQMLSPLL